MTPRPHLPPDITVGFRPHTYDRKVFSPRVRAHLPARYLTAAGTPAAIVPPGGEGRFDCVVFQKAYQKRDLELARRTKEAGGRVILDLCDNHFWNPDGDPALAHRVERLEAMLALADGVTVSSPEIAKLVPAKPTFPVDDALEIPRGAAVARSLGGRVRGLRRRRTGAPLRLVWFGQSGNEHLGSGLVPLRNLLRELERLHTSLPLSLTVLSGRRKDYERHIAPSSLPTRFVRWRASTFATVFSTFDICLLPIEVNPFTVCKTNNRPLLSLLLGVPVVADDIPGYREFADWLFFGDWARSISEYAQRPDLAAEHVRGAQAHIARTYTDAHVVEQWRAALAAVFSTLPQS